MRGRGGGGSPHKKVMLISNPGPKYHWYMSMKISLDDIFSMLGRPLGSVFGMNDQNDNAYVRFHINSDFVHGLVNVFCWYSSEKLIL